MAIKRVHELTEITAALDADMLHIEEDSGQLDKRITKINFLKDIQLEVTTNTSSVGDMQTDITELRGLSPNNQIGVSYTLVLSDADSGEVWMNNGSANVVTIPTDVAAAFPIGTVLLVMMEGVGVTSITADAGVTLNGVVAGSGDLTQFNGVALKKRAVDTWIATPLAVT